MSIPYTIACVVHFCRHRKGGRTEARAGQKPALPMQVSGRIPRLARLMALALRFGKLLDEGLVKNFRTLARLGHVSQARISQIMSLLHLAPDIQEAILFRSRPQRGRDCLDLRKVLPLTKVADWHKQRRWWRQLSKVGQRA